MYQQQVRYTTPGQSNIIRSSIKSRRNTSSFKATKEETTSSQRCRVLNKSHAQHRHTPSRSKKSEPKWRTNSSQDHIRGKFEKEVRDEKDEEGHRKGIISGKVEVSVHAIDSGTADIRSIEMRESIKRREDRDQSKINLYIRPLKS